MKLSALIASIGLLAATHPLPPAGDEIRDLQWHLDALEISAAHAITRGSGVVVAVIDTGVDATHPDLGGTTMLGADFTQSGGGLGQSDIDGHGTGVAGIVGAHGRALGIAPDAQILPIRSAPLAVSFGNDASDEINWAVDHRAKVLCLAFVENGPSSAAEQAAVARAIERDVVIIAAVGNTDQPAGAYPSAYPGVVVVTGTDRTGKLADISRTGPHAVLAAPAVDIITTAPASRFPTGYATLAGTSASTAIVAGVAALIRAKYPNLSASEVIHRMTATADDKGPPGRDDEYGYGIVNPVRALTADVPPLTTSPSPNANPEPSAPTGGPSKWWLLLIPVAAVALITAGFRARRR